MKLNLKKIICVGILCTNMLKADNYYKVNTNKMSQSNSKKCNLFGKTFFSFRPQDSNVARRMVGVIDKLSQDCNECSPNQINIGLQYTETFKSKKLAEYFSFTGNKKMSYGPTCNDFDIYGINLGTTAIGNVNLNPKIKNVIVDVDMCNSWDKCIDGLWSRLTLPFVYTRNELNMKECCNEKGKRIFPKNLVTVGIDNDTKVPFKNLVESFDLPKKFGSAPILGFGRIFEKRHDAQIAGIHLELGYDFYKYENNFFGVGLHFVIPTGTKPDAQFLFEPVCGAQNHGQIGATIHAGYSFWQSCTGDQNLSIYFDSIITHLFASKQRRLFGLKVNGHSSPGSSYLLLKEFDANGEVISLARAANLLALESKIKSNIMSDLALMIQYNFCNLISGLGWNFWSRSKEIITDSYCNPFEKNKKYAIKGNTLANNNFTESNSTIGTCSAIETDSVFLTFEDIDSSLALNPNTFSNKIFGFIGYNWKNYKSMPYVLFQTEIEVGHKNTAANQWSLLLKLGISF